MAATTWNASDKSATIGLTGSNLIATATGLGSVRGVHPKRTGKYYFEYSVTTTQGSTNTLGLATIRTPLGVNTAVAASIGPAAGSGSFSAFDAFGTQIGGLGSVGGAYTTGAVICVAVDLDARLIWFRQSAAGNWNNSSSNNPATAVGGANVAGVGLGQGIDVYPFALLQTSGNSITANFGATGLAGTVPSGFTSGWDDSVSTVTNVLLTQVAIEEWASVANAAAVTSSIYVMLMA